MNLGGGPALRLLIRLKLKATLRKQLRRVKTPSGLILTLVGVGLIGLWLMSLLLDWMLQTSPPSDPETLSNSVRLGALMLTVLSVTSSMSHRGLFLPREEIERLFSAPVRRGDLVRYRLLVALGRGAFGGVIFGVILMRHTPSAWFGFLGAFVAVETLPLVAQIAAILSGALERQAYRRFKVAASLLMPLLMILGGLALWVALVGDGPLGDSATTWMGAAGPARLLEHPVVSAMTAPFLLWARAVTATSVGEFLPWLTLSLGLWWLLYEVAARLPVDYRELSLETSANVAARIRRLRHGGGMTLGISRFTIGWGVPWILGRGPAGAVAWRKTGAILRKARGALLISVLVMGFVTILANSMMGGRGEGSSLGAVVLILFLGMMYLSGALRFDFRDELPCMESIKSWPLSPRRVFVAMLAPEVGLISALIVTAALARGLFAGRLDLPSLAAVAIAPLLVFAWVSLDNAVFLLMPTRMVPGQEGALQNVGRSILLVFLRIFLLGVILLSAVGPAAGVWWLCSSALGLAEQVAVTAAVVTSFGLLALLDLLLVQLGSWTFQRFDVARDRG